MQKLLISAVFIASLQLLAACSSSSKARLSDNEPNSSFLESLPIVYRPDIQQGNVVTQEMVNQLEPGMSRRQVRFLLGTPMLIDVFHQNRWDYVYTLTEGWGDMQMKRITLYFEADQLMRIEGDMRPMPEAETAAPPKETVVSVPDYDGSGDGFFTRAAEAVEGIWSTEPEAARSEKEIQKQAEELVKEEENAPLPEPVEAETNQ